MTASELNGLGSIPSGGRNYCHYHHDQTKSGAHHSSNIYWDLLLAKL
jgi:hypothetical protein